MLISSPTAHKELSCHYAFNFLYTDSMVVKQANRILGEDW